MSPIGRVEPRKLGKWGQVRYDEAIPAFVLHGPQRLSRGTFFPFESKTRWRGGAMVKGPYRSMNSTWQQKMARGEGHHLTKYGERKNPNNLLLLVDGMQAVFGLKCGSSSFSLPVTHNQHRLYTFSCGIYLLASAPSLLPVTTDGSAGLRIIHTYSAQTKRQSQHTHQTRYNTHLQPAVQVTAAREAQKLLYLPHQYIGLTSVSPVSQPPKATQSQCLI